MKAFWSQGAGLRYVQIDPDDATRDVPLVVAIHGRGADATDLAGLAHEISPDGYRWVLPQGPLPVPIAPGFIGWAWYDLGETQVDTVRASRELLAAFTDDTLRRTGASRDRTVLVGFSQGAVMALHVGLGSPQPFGAVVAMSGHLPAAEDLLPTLAQRQERKVLIVHGTEDQVLPVERGRKIRDVLDRVGLSPEYYEFPMGHQITTESLAVVRAFIARTVPPAMASPAEVGS